ncbi:hypothetical protein HDV01_001331 [Terramyces sp. JEL0728]|nr:hypothetical protein HDV01_001331 [Terramyces sp. JEL0728]
MFPQFKSFKKQIQPTINQVEIGPAYPTENANPAYQTANSDYRSGESQNIDIPINEYKKRKKKEENQKDKDFFIDKKRDLDNLKYESIRNQAIPIYKKRKSKKEKKVRYYLDELPQEATEPQEIGELKETSDFIPLNQPYNYEKFKKEKPNTYMELLKNEPMERQIGILEKAIHETCDIEYVYLLLEKIEIVWETRTVLDTWDKYLMQYEDYRQRSIISFKFTKILDIYREIIDLKLYESERIQLLKHLAVFLYKCGYTEFSTCLYQANIEYNYYYDQEFEVFFDLEFPLFGMEGSLGCKNYYRNGWDVSLLEDCIEDSVEDIGNIDFEMSSDGEISDDSGVKETKKLSKIKEYETNWYQKERKLSQYYLPLRNSTNDKQTDAFRTVLFSDIQPFLFKIQSPELIFDFLNVLGLPIQTRSKRVYKELITFKQNGNYPVVNYCITPEFLFSKTQPPITVQLLADLQPRLAFILNVLKQSIEIDDVFLYYYLYIRILQDKSNIKDIKHYLSKDPMNLRLYNFYAQFLDLPQQSKVYKKILSVSGYPSRQLPFLDLCLLNYGKTESKSKSIYRHLIQLRQRPDDFEFILNLPQDEELYQHTLAYISLVPKLYRQLLDKYIALYPDNTLFKVWLYETEQNQYYKQWVFRKEDEMFKKWAFGEIVGEDMEMNKWWMMEKGELAYIELLIEKEFRICQ